MSKPPAAPPGNAALNKSRRANATQRNGARCVLLVALLGWPATAIADTGSDSLLDRQDAAVRAAVAQVERSVVRLQAIGGGDPLGGGDSKPTTGLLISADGLILTSSYGLDPRPSTILVSYASGERATAKLLAVDDNRRVALLTASRVPETAPQTPPAAAEPVVGQTAIAVGRTFRSDQPNVAVGIVSAVGRLYGRALQTDAAVSPANYGGPLVNLRGEVLGVLTPLAPKASGPTGGVGLYDSGIGFAVPLPAVLDRLERMRAGEDLHAGLAGIAFVQGGDYATPPKLRTVHPGGPAANAGLLAGDVILRVGVKEVATVNDYKLAANAAYAGDQLTVTARRGERTISVEIELAQELQPYRHPYLGVVADADAPADAPGVTLKAVLGGGPAEVGGLTAGDVLLTIGGDAVADRSAALTRLGATAPGDEVIVGYRRAGAERQAAVVVGTLSYGAEVSAASASGVTTDDLKLPGATRNCKITRPEGQPGRLPTIVWLGGASPNGVVVEAWSKAGCLVASPESAETTPDAERAFVADLLAVLLAREDVDPNRVAVGGSGRAALFALVCASAEAERLTGIVLDGWPGKPPKMPLSTPDRRLGLLVLGDGGRAEALADAATSRGYPVLKSKPASTPAWAHGLDRF